MKRHDLSDSIITEIYGRQADRVYRLSCSLLKNAQDAEDAVQETFMRMIHRGPSFENEDHEKAWLLKTCQRVCFTMLKRRKTDQDPLEEHYDLGTWDDQEELEMFLALITLAPKYRAVIYLYYYEGYSGKEIAKIMGRPPSTIRNYLTEARRLLKKELGEDIDET
ncbi:MAG: RNA polymerase sigma factor [Lachnospiraceae bacterium]|nr:RNA polymerase sigma factor [Lachnospiraceae bacterium]